MIDEGEPRYGDLYAALDRSDKEVAERVLADLQARERAIDGRLRTVWNTVLANIEATSERAAAEQQEALEILLVLLALALVVGVVVTFWSQRVLSPLPQL